MNLEVCKKMCGVNGFSIDEENPLEDNISDIYICSWKNYSDMNSWKDCFNFKYDIRKINEIFGDHKYKTIEYFYAEIFHDEFNELEKEFIENIHVTNNCPFRFEHEIMGNK
jgi:hypothetical protein